MSEEQSIIEDEALESQEFANFDSLFDYLPHISIWFE